VTAEPSPPLASATCPLCESAIAVTDERCPTCGYALDGVDGRPAALSRSALWWSIAVLAAVYVLTLAIVAMTR
jgi:predicted amidophosphoribosyltransferase